MTARDRLLRPRRLLVQYVCMRAAEPLPVTVYFARFGGEPMPMHQTPNRDLLPGCRVRVKDQPAWGTGTVLDVADAALVLVGFDALGRTLKVGRAAVEPVDRPKPDA